MINLPTLIKKTADGAGADMALTRRFLHELFQIVEAELAEGKTVTIKGIGTFARGFSADKPVIFQADEELAARINEPFSAFEPVELHTPAAPEPAVAAQADLADEAVDAAAAEPVAPVQSDLHDEPETTPETEAEPETAPDPEVEAEAETEAEPETEPATEVESEPETDAEDEPEPEPEAEAEPETEPALPDEQEEQEKEIEEVMEYYPQTSRQSATMWLILGVFIGLIVGLVGGYFAGRAMLRYEMPISDEELFAGDDDADDEEASEAAIQPEQPAEAEQPAAEEQAEAAAEPATAASAAPATSAPAPAAAPAPVYDTVTTTLAALAKKHYGHTGWWVFIFNANPELKDPNRVTPNTRLLIPPKESFAGATDEETNAKAQKLLNSLPRR